MGMNGGFILLYRLSTLQSSLLPFPHPNEKREEDKSNPPERQPITNMEEEAKKTPLGNKPHHQPEEANSSPSQCFFN